MIDGVRGTATGWIDEKERVQDGPQPSGNQNGNHDGFAVVEANVESLNGNGPLVSVMPKLNRCTSDQGYGRDQNEKENALFHFLPQNTSRRDFSMHSRIRCRAHVRQS